MLHHSGILYARDAIIHSIELGDDDPFSLACAAVLALRSHGWNIVWPDDEAVEDLHPDITPPAR